MISKEARRKGSGGKRRGRGENQSHEITLLLESQRLTWRLRTKFLENLYCKSTFLKLVVHSTVKVLERIASLSLSLSLPPRLSVCQLSLKLSLIWTHSEVGWKRTRRSGGGKAWGDHRFCFFFFSSLSLQLSRVKGDTVGKARSPTLLCWIHAALHKEKKSY